MGEFELISEETERVASAVVDSAIKVHRVLGPGLLESVYEQCLAHELEMRGFTVRRQVPVPIVFEGIVFEVGYRMDVLVNEAVIVECKAVRELTAIDRQQTLTHIRLADKRLGFLINFNLIRLKDGLVRLIN